MTPTDSLRVVTMDRDGLYHGCLVGDRPTPSGCHRPSVRVSSKTGHVSAADAAREIAEAFPDLEVPDVSGLPDLRPLPDLPSGTRVTVVTPKGDKGAARAEANGCAVDVADVHRLVRAGRLVEDSSSGNDPALEARYDHYVAAGIRRG